MTIVESIKAVLITEKRPLTAKEIYEHIVNDNLYKFNAKNPRSIVAGQIRRHCQGIVFPTASPVKHFKLVEKNKYDILRPGEKSAAPSVRSDERDKTTDEKIQELYLQHRKNVEQELLRTIVSSEPVFFEQLVLDLLLRMGYGKNGSASRRGNGKDAGIDGEILQDKLGFDRIYVQAKRYDSTPVGRPQIQQFIGALENIEKGVFITTARFTEDAAKFAAKQQQKTLVLIDGERLTQLMIDYELGIQRVANYTTFKLDTDYFSDN